jgi:NAD(P)H-hydrate epimerase
MKIPGAEQIRAWDQYTIEHEPITSLYLMERAAGKCFEWLEQHDYTGRRFSIFCGKGNNGGDGLALARMLMASGPAVTVYILAPIAIGTSHKGTEDFRANLTRLHQYPGAAIHFIQSEENFPMLAAGTVIIDALFGTGLTRPLEGITARLAQHINNSGCEIISIDIPSGLKADHSSKGSPAVKARHTLTFQCYKPALLVAENADYIGEVSVLDIGLHSGFYQSMNSKYELIDDSLIQKIYKPRYPFSHKGNFGHALIIAGSYGKMGAAVLAAKACMRSGVGLLTCHIPKCGYEILQTAVPEAMVITDFNSSFITKIDPDAYQDDAVKYDVAGIGPGIGTASETRNMLKEFLSSFRKPFVLDADALNSLAMEKKLSPLPPGSVLTPHPKEFERLFDKSENDFERIEKALTNAALHNCIIVLKGHNTFIATPAGRGYFNTTGNAGMATAGSGDVLTGILTGLSAQGYTPEQSAILGVHLHGMAGDIAASKFSQEAMVAGDIVACLEGAFNAIRSTA